MTQGCKKNDQCLGRKTRLGQSHSKVDICTLYSTTEFLTTPDIKPNLSM